jgi:hypothetical protein
MRYPVAQHVSQVIHEDRRGETSSCYVLRVAYWRFIIWDFGFCHSDFVTALKGRVVFELNAEPVIVLFITFTETGD